MPLIKRVVLMSGPVGGNAWNASPMAEWSVKLSNPEAQAVYAAAWPLSMVPFDDSTTCIRLEDREREALRAAGTRLVVALEALLRLWADLPTSRMTLHDQLALAEAQHPGGLWAGSVGTVPTRKIVRR